MKDIKDFKNELLQYLLQHCFIYVDISHITDKYCLNDNFEKENIEKRLTLSNILKELKELNWIEYEPFEGVSAGFRLNSLTNKKEFIVSRPPKAKLTIKGLDYLTSLDTTRLTTQLIASTIETNKSVIHLNKHQKIGLYIIIILTFLGILVQWNQYKYTQKQDDSNKQINIKMEALSKEMLEYEKLLNRQNSVHHLDTLIKKPLK